MNNCKSYVFNQLLEKIYLLRNILNDSFYVILTYLHNKIIVNNTKKPGMKKRTKSKYNVSEHPYKKKGIKKVFFAFSNSFSGFSLAFKEESAFRQELFLSIVLIPLALFLPATFVEKILMIGSIMVLLIVELLNSSIEAIIDRISLEHHDLSKKAKDLGSAAVFISLMLVFIIYLTFIVKYC